MNLSTKQIDKNALQVLTDYGLKFTSVPRQHLTELKTDIKRFARKLRLIEFFADKELQDDESFHDRTSLSCFRVAADNLVV